MSPSFQAVVKRNPFSKFIFTTLALPSSHPPLKNGQRIFIFFCWIIRLVFSKNSQVFEDNYMVTAFKMTVEIGPPKDNPKVFQLSFAHLKNKIHLFRSILIVINESLTGKIDNLFYFFPSALPLKVKILLDQAVRVEMLRSLLPFESGDKAVKLAHHIQQSLLSVADVLENLLTVDAIIKTEMNQWLPQSQILCSVGIRCSFDFLSLEFAEIGGSYGIFFVASDSPGIIFRNFITLQFDVLA